jgi:hypothetical protein
MGEQVPVSNKNSTFSVAGTKVMKISVKIAFSQK